MNMSFLASLHDPETWKAIGFATVVMTVVLNVAKLLVNTYTDYHWTWVFAWYDLWVGFYWDRKNRLLYFFPIPMFGMYLAFPPIQQNVKFRVLPSRIGRRDP